MNTNNTDKSGTDGTADQISTLRAGLENSVRLIGDLLENDEVSDAEIIDIDKAKPLAALAMDMVPKPHTEPREWRLVVDYRELNKLIKHDTFEPPSCDLCLSWLAGRKCRTVADLRWGFHQCGISEHHSLGRQTCAARCGKGQSVAGSGEQNRHAGASSDHQAHDDPAPGVGVAKHQS